jgi:parallel beta-helix repeat protein
MTGSLLGNAARIFSLSALVIALAFVGAQPAQANGNGNNGYQNLTSCNQLVTGNVRLMNDLLCTDSDGIVVGANNVNIKLNGFSIRCHDPGDPGSYKFSCQGGDPEHTFGRLSISLPSATDPDTGAETFDYGIDTNGFSHVTVEGPGMIQGFDIGVYVYGGNLDDTRPNASHVRVTKLNITGPDGEADLSTLEPDARPQTWGILVQNFLEYNRCYDDYQYHSNCKCKDDSVHGHGVEISSNAVDNHAEGIALYNASRVHIRTNFVHDTNDAGENGSFVQSHGIVVCANTPFCTPGVSRRNKLHNNLLVDNGMNVFFETMDDPLTPQNEGFADADGAITITGNAKDNDVFNNTVMGNNGDGISVRDGASSNKISNNLAVYNTSTDAPYDPLNPENPGTSPFFDIANRKAGPNNWFSPTNKCLTENDPAVPATVCNPGENDDWQ